MFQNRRTQNRNEVTERITNRVSITWLRTQIPYKEIESIDDKHANYIKKVVEWYGPLGAILAIRLNNTKIKGLEIYYK